MKSFRKVKKNKVGKYFEKNKNNLDFNAVKYADADTVDLTIDKTKLKNLKTTLKELCVEHFEENMDIYKKNKLACNIRFFFTYDVPLVALLLGNCLISSLPQKSEIVPTYKLQSTILCDDKMSQESDGITYYISSLKTDLDEKQFVKVERIPTQIQYHVKNGTEGVILDLKVNNNTGKISYNTYSIGDFFDVNAGVFKNNEVENTEAKYIELLKNIDEIVMNNEDVPESVKEAIKTLLEEEETVIITTVSEYIKTGDMEVLESTKQHFIRKYIDYEAFLIGFIIVWELVMYGILKNNKYGIIEADRDGSLHMYKKETYVIPFYTAQARKKEFIKADEARLNKILNFAEDNLSSDNYNEILEIVEDVPKHKSLTKKDY